MITYLTPEQEALIPVVKDKWRKIALDNSSTDQEKSEAVINKLYRNANLKLPQKVIWFDNPVDACLWLGEKSASNLSVDPIEWTYPCSVDGLVERNLHTTIQ